MDAMCRRIAALAAALVLLAGGPAAAEDPPAAGADVVRVTILHTNDLHGHVERFAAVAAAAKAERARSPRTLLLDAGDCITGTPVSTWFRGMPVFDVMNRMGYDAGTLGNHDFDHGWTQTHAFVERAVHPLLCANAKDPDGKPFGDGPSRVFDLGGVRVGVLGLVTDGVPALTTTQATAGCTFEAPVAAARRLVPELRKQADVVVLLTHCGVQADAALAGAVAGIDLVVGGHSHTKLTEPVVVRVPTPSDPDPAPTRIVQTGAEARALGVVDLDWSRSARRVTGFSYRLVPLEGAKVARDPDVQELVDRWEAKVAPVVGEVIGKAPAAISRKRLRAVLERIWRDAAGADLGYQNAGGVRDDVAAGPVRVADVVRVLPFENTLVRIRIPGDRLPEFLRRRLGAAFDPKRTYVVATDSFAGDQRERFLRVKDVPVEDTGRLTRDVAVEWVRRHGGFDAGAGGEADDDP